MGDQMVCTRHEDCGLTEFDCRLADEQQAEGRADGEVPANSEPIRRGQFTEKQLRTIEEALLYYGVKTTPPGQAAADCDDALCAVYDALGVPAIDHTRQAATPSSALAKVEKNWRYR